MVTDFRGRDMADEKGQWGHCIAYDIGTPDESFEWVYIPVCAGCRERYPSETPQIASETTPESRVGSD